MNALLCSSALLSKSFIDIHLAGQNTMATKIKLKLKTVFVLYFMVSLLGLVYALMQLGKLFLQRSDLRDL